MNEYIKPIEILAYKDENLSKYDSVQDTMLRLSNLENILIEYRGINSYGTLFESMINEMKKSKEKLVDSNNYFKEHIIKNYLYVK
jgi:hypothetical protein